MTDPEATSAGHPDARRRDRREAGLRFVYAGNLPGRVGPWENTRCPSCQATLIERYRLPDPFLSTDCRRPLPALPDHKFRASGRTAATRSRQDRIRPRIRAGCRARCCTIGGRACRSLRPQVKPSRLPSATKEQSTMAATNPMATTRDAGPDRPATGATGGRGGRAAVEAGRRRTRRLSGRACGPGQSGGGRGVCQPQARQASAGLLRHAGPARTAPSRPWCTPSNARSGTTSAFPPFRPRRVRFPRYGGLASWQPSAGGRLGARSEPKAIVPSARMASRLFAARHAACSCPAWPSNSTGTWPRFSIASA